MHQKAHDAIEKALPLSIDIGLFHVNVEPVRSYLLGKRKKLAREVLGVLGKRLRQSADEVCKEFTAIASTLQEKPNGIEDLSLTRDYMSTLGDVLKSLNVKGSRAIADWTLLGDFQCNMSDDDSNVLWKTYGWPKKVQELYKETIANHLKDEERFKDNLSADVAAFADHIVNLQKQVHSFFNHDDIKHIESTAVEARKIQKSLEEAQSNAETYRARQGRWLHAALASSAC
jgi:dynein heavy chain